MACNGSRRARDFDRGTGPRQWLFTPREPAAARAQGIEEQPFAMEIPRPKDFEAIL